MQRREDVVEVAEETSDEPVKDARMVKIEALSDELHAACAELPESEGRRNAMTFASHVKLWAASALANG